MALTSNVRDLIHGKCRNEYLHQALIDEYFDIVREKTCVLSNFFRNFLTVSVLMDQHQFVVS